MLSLRTLGHRMLARSGAFEVIDSVDAHLGDNDDPDRDPAYLRIKQCLRNGVYSSQKAPRRAGSPPPGSPNYFPDYLDEIKFRGYAGGFSRLARFLANGDVLKAMPRPSVRHLRDARSVRTLRPNMDAVRNAVKERRSNGQTEGQVNRSKTLRRAMNGRPGTEPVRARMLRPHLEINHAS
jgi:hypothetical protein